MCVPNVTMFYQQTLDSFFFKFLFYFIYLFYLFIYLTSRIILDLCMTARRPAIAAVSVCCPGQRLQ